VAPFWARYQQVFSKDGLPHAEPADFHYFANVDAGARPGNMSVFNLEWTSIGPAEGARRVRESVDYLLYAPNTSRSRTASPGFSTRERDRDEGLEGISSHQGALHRAARPVHPDLTYSSVNGGKKELASQIWGLQLPDASKVSWTIGRLILWSNDVLLQLAGAGFVHMQHVSQFLWMAKDQEAKLRG
jgi:hypothetical protein